MQGEAGFMSHRDDTDKTKYSLDDLTGEELAALIDAYPGGREPDDAFLAELMGRYADRAGTPELDAEAQAAQARLMEKLEAGRPPERAGKPRPRRALRCVLAAAVLCAALGGAVLASDSAVLHAVIQSVTRADWLQTVFGDGIDGAKETEMSYPGHESYTLPARERVTIDTDAADAAVGDSVIDVNMAVTEGDWTFTVESLVMDENGMGALSYTIENPNGLDQLSVSEYADELLSPLPRAYLTGESGTVPVAVKTYISGQGRTDTKVRAAAYLGVTDGTTDVTGGGYTLVVDFGDGNGMALTEGEDGGMEPIYVISALSVPAVLDRFAASVALTAPGGWTACVSPVGLRMDQNGAIGDSSFSAEELIIRFRDGSEYVVEGTDPDRTNYAYGFVVSDGRSSYGSHRYVFNRVAAPEEVASVEATGGYQDDWGWHDLSLTFVP